eukprot:TRINITY_DN27405_c0_g1_i2.p1 TRINITY_DN27405_c0_g1~~TRINITY_DN27405_c0_g1_i2.p1  ORF type:complete len:240 (-),score=2.85 TRINITY_DN27405_c0_g1_i2:41-682(-)
MAGKNIYEIIDEAKKPKKKSVAAIERKPLDPRREVQDFSQLVGQKKVISIDTPAEHAGGFYCDLCDCAVKDSNTWLDHINGRKHQRARGFSMRPEKSTLDEVKKVLKGGKKKEDLARDEALQRLRKKMEKEVESEVEPKRRRTSDPLDTAEETKEEAEVAAVTSEPELVNKKVGDSESPKAETKEDSKPSIDGEEDWSSFGLPVGFGGAKKNR